MQQRMRGGQRSWGLKAPKGADIWGPQGGLRGGRDALQCLDAFGGNSEDGFKMCVWGGSSRGASGR